MRKISISALLIAACLGTTAMLAYRNDDVATSGAVESRFAADGAFRDGLYLGRLAAEAGQPLLPAIGRWSTERDRSTFAAGYRRGYSDSVAEEANVTDAK